MVLVQLVQALVLANAQHVHRLHPILTAECVAYLVLMENIMRTVTKHAKVKRIIIHLGSY